MQFFTTLVSLSALVSLAAAQLQFTFTFTSVTAGQPTNVSYSGDGGAPVTITLREGNPSALSTVGVLTTSATGGSYIWTPDTSLPSASDYALEISQGSTINYSGLITLVGGSAASASGSSATVTAANSTVTVGPLSTGASGSAGTGGSNSTISSATLTRGTTTIVTGVTASGTGAGSTSTTVPSTNSAAGLSSSLTLVFGAVVALIYFS